MKIILKGCPKCGGDMYDETDWFGPYRTCLQCSCVIYLKSSDSKPESITDQEKRQKEGRRRGRSSSGGIGLN